MFMNEEEEGTLPSSFEIYASEAANLYKNSEYRKAISVYTTALELRPENKDALVARSKCYLKLGDADNALKDAEMALAEDENFHRGLYAKAETLYYMGDFEMALVFYHRGSRVRPELNEFSLGIQKAQEAIDNAVGSPEKVTLTTKGDLTFMKKQTEKKVAKPKVISLGKKTEEQKQIKPQKISNRKQEAAVKQLLGRLYGDREYLEKLLKEITPRSQCGKKVCDLCEEGIVYLDTRSEFWRQHKPIYSRVHDKKTMLVGHAPVNPKKTMNPNEYIIEELNAIDKALACGRHTESLDRAKCLLSTIEKYVAGVVHNKHEVLANLYSLMGNAYLEIGEYLESLQCHKNDYELGVDYNMHESISRSLDNMGRVYARTGKYMHAVDTWMKKVPMCQSDLERAWLYHEIGRCYLEMHEGDQAKHYGERSLAAAEEADDPEWVLQATVLIAQAQVKLLDHNSAVETFKKALDLANIIGDDKSNVAILSAIDDVNRKIVEAIKKHHENPPPPEQKPSADEQDQVEADHKSKTSAASERQTEGETELPSDNETESDVEITIKNSSGIKSALSKASEELRRSSADVDGKSTAASVSDAISNNNPSSALM